MQLTIDCRTGVHNKDIDVANADTAEALFWLKKLDGNQHTLMNLGRSDGRHVMIGGGPSWYIVMLGDGQNSLTLQNRNGDEVEMIELCAGGQYGEYPRSICVDQMQAAQVVNLFFKGAEIDAAWL